MLSRVWETDAPQEFALRSTHTPPSFARLAIQPQERANATDMEEQLEKLAISTPVQQKRREEVSIA